MTFAVGDGHRPCRVVTKSALECTAVVNAAMLLVYRARFVAALVMKSALECTAVVNAARGRLPAGLLLPASAAVDAAQRAMHSPLLLPPTA